MRSKYEEIIWIDHGQKRKHVEVKNAHLLDVVILSICETERNQELRFLSFQLNHQQFNINESQSLGA